MLCELEKIIKYLTTKNSYGYNEIPFKILKLSVSFIICPLTNICNKSLSFRVFPDRLKFTIVKPISKNGNRLISSKYRPISLLTSFSKVFEKLMYARLYKLYRLCNRFRFFRSKIAG